MSGNPAASISGVSVAQNAHQGIVKLSGSEIASPLHFFLGGGVLNASLVRVQ
jgi:hypothetical protein